MIRTAPFVLLAALGTAGYLPSSALRACGVPAAETDASPTPALVDSTFAALFAAGQTFPDFIDAAVRRREGWLRITAGAEVSDEAVARATAVGGNWRLLVVAIDACGDSMQSVPYAAKLAERVPGLSLRIVPPSEGRPAQDAHRSLDGRRATPTFVLLNEDAESVGCVVELPRELREAMHQARSEGVSSRKRHEDMAEWYEANRGQGIVGEVIAMMEGASRGAPVCDRGEADAEGAS